MADILRRLEKMLAAVPRAGETTWAYEDGALNALP